MRRIVDSSDAPTVFSEAESAYRAVENVGAHGETIIYAHDVVEQSAHCVAVADDSNGVIARLFVPVLVVENFIFEPV